MARAYLETSHIELARSPDVVRRQGTIPAHVAPRLPRHMPEHVRRAARIAVRIEPARAQRGGGRPVALHRVAHSPAKAVPDRQRWRAATTIRGTTTVAAEAPPPASGGGERGVAPSGGDVGAAQTCLGRPIGRDELDDLARDECHARGDHAQRDSRQVDVEAANRRLGAVGDERDLLRRRVERHDGAGEGGDGRARHRMQLTRFAETDAYTGSGSWSPLCRNCSPSRWPMSTSPADDCTLGAKSTDAWTPLRQRSAALTATRSWWLSSSVSTPASLTLIAPGQADENASSSSCGTQSSARTSSYRAPSEKCSAKSARCVPPRTRRK
eukprot:1791822-Prymnesium_polylepis.1